MKKRQIVLVGMSGVGKTTVGKEIAHLLSYELIDTDKEIEIMTNKEIKEIFSCEGEKAFRLLERKILAKALQKDKVVIVTGGGIILEKENRNDLKKTFTIWIKRDIDSVLESDLSDRPLLQGQKGQTKEKWCQLYKERSSLYDEVSQVWVNNKHVKDTVYEILRVYNENISD